MNTQKKKAFTLAEIMIVFAVIAIITAILLPAARNAMPDESLMKFKKAHNALYSAINELVNSDKYYLDGDLGMKADGTQLNSLALENRKYFCQTLGDVLSSKELNCFDDSVESRSVAILNNPADSGVSGVIAFRSSDINGTAVTSETMAYWKNRIDENCIYNTDKNIYRQIVTQDGIWYYDNSPQMTFGVYYAGIRHFSSPDTFPAIIRDENGFDTLYKVVCIDIDGVPDDATVDECVNECPFGYGIRVDGKILNGARADEWLAKSIQEKD